MKPWRDDTRIFYNRNIRHCTRLNSKTCVTPAGFALIAGRLPTVSTVGYILSSRWDSQKHRITALPRSACSCRR